MNLKPFNLEAALRGEKVVTRSGEKVGTIAHFPEIKGSGRSVVFAAVSNMVLAYTVDGERESARGTDHDLFMAPKTEIVKVHLYRHADRPHYIYAQTDRGPTAPGNYKYLLKTIEVEIEE